MIRVSVEVRSEVASFRVAVWAESIERALRVAGRRYPGCETKVLFPINPEAFFAKKGPALASRMVLPQAPEEAAG